MLSNGQLRRYEAVLLLCAIAVGWGTAWPVIKVILRDIPPLWTLVLRSVIGTTTLFAISAKRRALVLPKRGDVPVILNIALLHMVAFAALKRFPSDLNRWDSQAVKDGRVFVH